VTQTRPPSIPAATPSSRWPAARTAAGGVSGAGCGRC